MPNEVENVLTVRGEKADLEKFCSLVRTSESDFDFNAIKSYPATGDFDDDWLQENWGTNRLPRNVSVSECPGGLEYWFLTAWSPPLPIVLSASSAFPALLFTLEYAEAGLDFSGLYETKAGKVRKEWAGAYTPAVWNPAVDMEEYERQFSD